jgi:hypothetical protein
MVDLKVKMTPDNEVYLVTHYHNIEVIIKPDRKLMYDIEKGKAERWLKCLEDFLLHIYKLINKGNSSDEEFPINEGNQTNIFILYDYTGKELHVYDVVSWKIRNIRQSNIDAYNRIKDAINYVIKIVNNKVKDVIIRPYKGRYLVLQHRDYTAKLLIDESDYSIVFYSVDICKPEKILEAMKLYELYDKFMMEVVNALED